MKSLKRTGVLWFLAVAMAITAVACSGSGDKTPTTGPDATNTSQPELGG